MNKEIFFEVDGGTLPPWTTAAPDVPVLLVHGSGHNAAAWTAVAAELLPGHRVIAVDLRGHGHSTAESRTAEQYWRDLAVVVAASGWDTPLLVGHSTGGYAVTAVTAAGLVEPGGICIVDGLVLDDRQTASRALAEFRTPDAADDLRRTFGYGRCFDERITCPMTIVLAEHGFYASRRKEITTIVQAAPQRHIVDIASGHNVVMTHPQELAAAITAMTT